jgi:predicted hydrocarbon binding protein
MPFHVSRFCKSFTDIAGKEPSSVLDTDLSEYQKLKTPLQKARFIKALMDDLIDKTSKAKAKRIMRECGYTYQSGVSQCVGEPIVKKAKKLYKESKNISEFLAKLNANHIGGGHLRLKQGVVEASYDRCYCGAVSKAKERIPLTYCYCATGWYKRVFEEALSKPVEVEVLQAIANGADRCEFRIHV